MSHLTSLRRLFQVTALAAAVLSLPYAGKVSTAQTLESPAQTEVTQAPAANAATGWTTNTEPVTPEEPEGAESTQEAKPPFVLTPEQISLLARINAYLNSLVHVQGRFIQTDHKNEETKGRFYVHRPGRMRFDYASPSRLRIVSDGQYLSVEDHDLKTVDKYPLDATPIQLLLGKDVNLTRDAIILDMRQDENAVVVTLRDRSGTAAGHLQLFFKHPELELYEWVITDAQGLDTRVQLGNFILGEKKADTFFAASDIELNKLKNN